MSAPTPIKEQLDPVEVLNGFLRGEQAAVESYDAVIDNHLDQPIPGLIENRECHRGRARLLSDRIVQLNATPVAAPEHLVGIWVGVWKGLGQLIEGSANVLGKQEGLLALADDEDRLLTSYRKNLGLLDPQSRSVVESGILPNQERTCQVARVLAQGGDTHDTPRQGPGIGVPLILFVAGLTVGLGACGERPVVLHQVPEPAYSAIIEQADGRLITAIQQDRLYGRERFSVTVVDGDQHQRYAVDDAGNACP